jgi:hypothetical protein
LQSKFTALLQNLSKKENYLIFFLVLVTLVISIQSILLGSKTFNGIDGFTNYNNYIIFKQSYFHLIQGQDLYQWYLNEQWDLFKYSPTFSLFMAPLALLPDWLGLFLWNLINVMVLFFAFKKLPLQTNRKLLLMILFLIIELITSLQNSQSNALMAGLMIMTINHLEAKNYHWAAFVLIASLFLKIFGVLAVVMFLFYPNKLKSTLYLLFWFLVLFFAPLIVVRWEQLLFLYQSWWQMLQNDHSASIGLSVSGWLQTWFGWYNNKMWVTLMGLLILALPLIKINHYKNLDFRIKYLASLLIWVVIFNHKAESPTFIIALSGIVIWYFSQPSNHFNLTLLLMAFVFTVLSPTDLFPRIWREEFFQPYVIKAVPCIFIWLKINYEMLFDFEPIQATQLNTGQN